MTAIQTGQTDIASELIGSYLKRGDLYETKQSTTLEQDGHD